MVWDLGCFENCEEKNELMNESINNKAVVEQPGYTGSVDYVSIQSEILDCAHLGTLQPPAWSIT